MAPIPPDNRLVRADDDLPLRRPKPAGDGALSAMMDPSKQSLHERLRRHLLATVTSHRGERLNQEELRLELTRVADALLAEQTDGPDLAEQGALIEEILDELLGYGPIAELMRDHEITDILINGPRQVYYEKRGQLHAAKKAFEDEEQLMEVVRRMLIGSGRQLDERTRMLDARTPDGSRLNIVAKPPALNGPLVSIRRFGARPLIAADLVTNDTLTSEMLDFLAGCVKARINLIISGGTGSGKTTLLNALSRFIPETERIVTIEDTAELELQQRHVAKMEVITATTASAEPVSLRELVHNSLRMRPDRIIVGECRGAEALEMLQAMNTGHEGSMTTIHGNSPREVLGRIELMIGLAGIEMPVWAVRKLISSAINLVVHIARVPGGQRKVVHITEITGMEGDILCMQDIFEFVQTGVDAKQAAVGHFRATGNRPRCLQKLQIRGAELAPQLFTARMLNGKKK